MSELNRNQDNDHKENKSKQEKDDFIALTEQVKESATSADEAVNIASQHKGDPDTI